MPISMLIPKANALNINLDTTGGITVIRNLKLEGRIALVTSILLLALWAPITTNAQPNAENESDKYTVTTDVHECVHCKLLHSAKGRPCPHADRHSSSVENDIASSVGFADVDPAADLFESVDSNAVTSNYEVSREYVGFADSDPTDSGVPAISTIRQFAGHSTWKNPIGFAETDPTGFEGAIEVVPNEVLVACQHMGTSSSFPSTVEFSGLTRLEDHS
ncbi:MAG: hypothetical protein KJN69_00945 [Gammaproteobacteria bacterium]|nr:hypothetical protein [Gammaproteobacteria bacterium]